MQRLAPEVVLNFEVVGTIVDEIKEVELAWAPVDVSEGGTTTEVVPVLDNVVNALVLKSPEVVTLDFPKKVVVVVSKILAVT